MGWDWRRRRRPWLEVRFPESEPPRKLRRVGVFRMADSRIYIITQF